MNMQGFYVGNSHLTGIFCTYNRMGKVGLAHALYFYCERNCLQQILSHWKAQKQGTQTKCAIKMHKYQGTQGVKAREGTSSAKMPKHIKRKGAKARKAQRGVI